LPGRVDFCLLTHAIAVLAVGSAFIITVLGMEIEPLYKVLAGLLVLVAFAVVMSLVGE
jgi:hypothetical protein